MMGTVEPIGDTKDWIEANLWIRNKASQIVPLILNEPQRRVLERFEAKREAREPVRFIILKARQEGVSTLIEAIMFHRSYTQAHRSGLVVSHKVRSARHLLSICDRYLQYIPNPRATDFSSRAEIKFSAPHHSDLQIETARDVDLGASFTLSDVHLSEVARYGQEGADPKDLMGHLVPAVPDLPDTMVVLESTAIAYGDFFHQFWQDAKDGKSEFEPIFLPWFIHDEYSKLFKSDEEQADLEVTLDDEERNLADGHGLSLEQLNWRRSKIKALPGGVDEFRRQYPANDEECFLVAGTCRFDTARLREMMALCEPPCLEGYLEEVEGAALNSLPKVRHRADGRGLVFQQQQGGLLKVWEKPKSGKTYVVGADTSEGVDGEESGLDPSSVHVLDVLAGRVVAVLHGFIDPDLLGLELSKLGRWYNTALVGVEANNHGLTTCKALQRAGYSRIYWRRIEDDRTRKRTRKIGWWTGPKTRGPLIDGLAAVIRDSELVCLDSPTLGECMGFVRNPNGKYEAATGGKDDRVISLAIAVKMAEEVHAYEPVVDEKPEGAYIDFDEMVRKLERENRSARMGA